MLPLRDTALRRVGFIPAGAALVLAGWAAYLGRGLSFPPSSGEHPIGYGELAAPVVASGAGLLLTTVRPRNPVGWLLTGYSLLAAAQTAATVCTGPRTTEAHRGTVVAALAFSLSGALWIVAYALLITLLMLYPDGCLPGARWRWACMCAPAGALLACTALALHPPRPEDRIWGEGPVTELPAAWADVQAAAGAVLLIAAALSAFAAAVVRAAHGGASQRQQVLWLMTGTAVLFDISFNDPPPGCSPSHSASTRSPS
ncbi:hypothetical protein [Streptomyces sp. NPDC005209]|uniref:hypothetical protein n=1 Tax=Streptomyces sp. NPDC005209 TaxID=3156715 RepID=UPI0033BEB782